MRPNSCGCEVNRESWLMVVVCIGAALQAPRPAEHVARMQGEAMACRAVVGIPIRTVRCIPIRGASIDVLLVPCVVYLNWRRAAQRACRRDDRVYYLISSLPHATSSTSLGRNARKHIIGRTKVDM